MEIITEKLACIAHELRSPLSSMNDIISYILTDIDNYEKNKHHLYKLLSINNEILNNVNDMFNFTKGNEAKQINIKNFAIFSLFKSINDNNKIMIESHNRKFNMNVLIDTNMIVSGDILKIKRIFTNIITNSLKYTKENGIIEFNVNELIYKEDEVFIKFEIKDNGIGMSPELLNQVFKKYVCKDKEKGTGLGLYLTKLLVDDLGGSIELFSEPGVGTRVIINLPFRYIARYDKDLLMNKKVLIVDDCKCTLMIYKDFLLNRKMKVTICDNYQEAKDFFINTKYDLVIVDYHLNGEYGNKIIADFKRINSECKMVLISANTLTEIFANEIPDYIDGFLVKPIDYTLSEELIYRILSNTYK